MQIIQTGFPGLYLINPRVFEDSRGYFFEVYNQKVFHDNQLDFNWVQDNQSRSSYGVIRGLHYQLNPYAQAKLVRVLAGTILDVAVDIRKGSPTYGQAYCVELSDQNKSQLLIPRGFAHGFSVLTDYAEVLYKCDNIYNKEAEGGICYNDPALQIDWKIPSAKAIISDKDKVHPRLQDCRNNFEFTP